MYRPGVRQVSEGSGERRKMEETGCESSVVPKRPLRLRDRRRRRSARRPNNDLLLHHDNAIAHTATATLDYLEANRVQLVTQTLYFLCLAFTCDFFLFPQVKQHLKGKQFQGVEYARLFRGCDF